MTEPIVAPQQARSRGEGGRPGPGGSSVALGVLRTMRPRQWIKNVLVIVAPVLSQRLLEPQVAFDTLIAFVVFSLAASGIYLVNDVRDVNEDRAHPRKRHRPVAAGIVPPAVAIGAAVVLLAGAALLSLLASTDLLVVIVIYEAAQLAYCLWLKDEPVIDIAVVAGGFLLRAIAGGAATGIELSQWFLLAAAFGSLFMAAGKRYAEARAHGTDTETRRSLGGYTQTYLRFVWSISAAILIMTYGLWAFQLKTESGSVLPAISIAPFVLAVLRYAVDVDAGKADEPEAIALRDRVLQLLAVIWLVLVGLAVYL